MIPTGLKDDVMIFKQESQSYIDWLNKVTPEGLVPLRFMIPPGLWVSVAFSNKESQSVSAGFFK